MAMISPERQAAYRRNRQTAGENGERRINTWVSTGAALALILATDKRITSRLDPASPAWSEYMRVTP